MLVFIIRRVIYMLITLALISFISFAVMASAPGNALAQEVQRLRTVGGAVSTNQINALYKQYGLDQPWIVQYWLWIKGFIHGDYGQSITARAPINQLIYSRLGLSLAFSFGSLFIAWGIAIPLGVYSATHRYKLGDNVVTGIQFIGVAVPEFLLALSLMYIFSKYVNIDVGSLYSNKYSHAAWSWGKFVDLFNHLWIPLLVISAGSTTVTTRLLRANLLDVVNQQYIQTARAKGVSERKVIWRHAVRNAIAPLLVGLGSTLTVLIGGEAVVSIVMNLPTTGPLLLNALLQKDMYLAGTLLMFSSMMLLVGNLIADLLLAWVDPRARAFE